MQEYRMIERIVWESGEDVPADHYLVEQKRSSGWFPVGMPFPSTPNGLEAAKTYAQGAAKPTRILHVTQAVGEMFTIDDMAEHERVWRFPAFMVGGIVGTVMGIVTTASVWKVLGL